MTTAQNPTPNLFRITATARGALRGKAVGAAFQSDRELDGELVEILTQNIGIGRRASGHNNDPLIFVDLAPRWPGLTAMLGLGDVARGDARYVLISIQDTSYVDKNLKRGSYKPITGTEENLMKNKSPAERRADALLADKIKEIEEREAGDKVIAEALLAEAKKEAPSCDCGNPALASGQCRPCEEIEERKARAKPPLVEERLVTWTCEGEPQQQVVSTSELRSRVAELVAQGARDVAVWRPVKVKIQIEIEE
jgi:hypothetical protein